MWQTFFHFFCSICYVFDQKSLCITYWVLKTKTNELYYVFDKKWKYITNINHLCIWQKVKIHNQICTTNEIKSEVGYICKFNLHICITLGVQPCLMRVFPNAIICVTAKGSTRGYKTLPRCTNSNLASTERESV